SAYAAGVTVHGADGSYYRVYATVANTAPPVPLSDIQIHSCGTDPTCATETAVCAPSGNPTPPTCASRNVNAGSSATWPDHWAGRANPDCSDTATNCSTLDTAVEL